MARLTTGNYDAVIMSQEQFAKIPLSKDRIISFLNNEIVDLKVALEAAKADDADISVKLIQRKLKSAQTKLEKKFTQLSEIPRLILRKLA